MLAVCGRGLAKGRRGPVFDKLHMLVRQIVALPGVSSFSALSYILDAQAVGLISLVRSSVSSLISEWAPFLDGLLFALGAVPWRGIVGWQP